MFDHITQHNQPAPIPKSIRIFVKREGVLYINDTFWIDDAYDYEFSLETFESWKHFFNNKIFWGLYYR